MPSTAADPCKLRHYPGDSSMWWVRWYLRYPISVAQMSEMTAERGLAISASCIWRWVQLYGPELDKRCRRHLKPTNKSWRLDETYIKVKGQTGQVHWKAVWHRCLRNSTQRQFWPLGFFATESFRLLHARHLPNSTTKTRFYRSFASR